MIDLNNDMPCEWSINRAIESWESEPGVVGDVPDAWAVARALASHRPAPPPEGRRPSEAWAIDARNHYRNPGATAGVDLGEEGAAVPPHPIEWGGVRYDDPKHYEMALVIDASAWDRSVLDGVKWG